MNWWLAYVLVGIGFVLGWADHPSNFREVSRINTAGKLIFIILAVLFWPVSLMWRVMR
jgi:hypothetical protein